MSWTDKYIYSVRNLSESFEVIYTANTTQFYNRIYWPFVSKEANKAIFEQFHFVKITRCINYNLRSDVICQQFGSYTAVSFAISKLLLKFRTFLQTASSGIINCYKPKKVEI